MNSKKLAKKAPAKKAGAPGTETFEQAAERKRTRARARSAERATKEKEWLESNVAGSGRLKGRPALYVRSFWEPDEHDRSGFDRRNGITTMFEQIRHKVHPDDHELVIKALSGTVAFHNLTRLIEDLEADDEWGDHESDLKGIRIGFELALQALDKALGKRGVVIEGLSRGGKNKPAPGWHEGCCRAADQMLETGTEPHELVGKLVQRFGHDRTSIARVLKKAGIK